MTTTDTTRRTVELPGFGAVPALPEELEPVALAAAEISAGTWGVVAWPMGDAAPRVIESDRQNPLWAARLGADLARSWRTDQVWLVRRMPGAVTVHTLDYAHPGNTLGTMLVEPAGADTYPDAWQHVLDSNTGDPDRDGLRRRSIFEAWRDAHGFAATASALDVITAATATPCEPLRYQRAYVLIVAASDNTGRRGCAYRTDAGLTRECPCGTRHA